MAGSTNKTRPTDASVAAFVAKLEPATKRADAEMLVKIFKDVTGKRPTMWGPSIIGFGAYHYRYESGREGDMCRSGFAPGKSKLSIYLLSGYQNSATEKKLAALRAKLGKHKVGASCLYINTMADVDIAVLRQMIEVDLDYMNSRYPET